MLACGIMICQSMAEKRDVGVRFVPETVGTNLEPAPTNRVFQRIDINTASAEELMTLPRVGSCTAARIIKYRKQHGKFSRAEELLNVKGIGPKTLAKIQKGICVGTDSIKANSISTVPASSTIKVVKTAVGAGSKPAPTIIGENSLININAASASELEALPGIGHGKAKAILDYRSSCGPFQEVEDILRVKGIGEKILERIKPLITTGEKTQGDSTSTDVIESTNKHE